MRAFTRREKTIFYVLVFLLGGSISANFFIFPFWEKFTNMQEEIEKKELLLKRYLHLISKEERLRNFYQDYCALLEKEDKPEEIGEKLFKEIDEIAKKSKLRINKIKPHPLEEKEGYKRIILEVELIGELASIFDFIYQLEKSSSLMRISSLRLSPHPQARGSSQLRCRISLTKIFF